MDSLFYAMPQFLPAILLHQDICFSIWRCPAVLDHGLLWYCTLEGSYHIMPWLYRGTMVWQVWDTFKNICCTVLNNNSQRAIFVLRALISSYTVRDAFWFQCTLYFRAQPCLDLKSFLTIWARIPMQCWLFCPCASWACPACMCSLYHKHLHVHRCTRTTARQLFDISIQTHFYL